MDTGYPTKSHEQCSKALLLDDFLGDYTSIYYPKNIGDYNNPIAESL